MPLELLTEMENAKRLVREHGSDMRYVPQRDKWLIWKDHRWIIDETGIVISWAKECARALWAMVALASGSEKLDLIRFATESERNSKIKAAIILAQTEPGIVAIPDQLDADPMLGGCPGGVVNLRSGELRPGRREDLITKSFAVDPSDAPCSLWLAFLNRIYDGNQGLIDYIQRLFGLFLTGDISVQELWVFFGVGANGKSVLLDTLLGILADYGNIAPESLLTHRTNSEHPTEIAGLAGKRLIVGSETESGATLRLQNIKRLTGDAKLTGRYMRCDYLTFNRTHKTILQTNNLPRVSESTEAVWRRLRVVPHAVVIPPGERDPNLLSKLRQEWPAILAWAVAGCLAWQKSGMQPPAEVMTATNGYRDESDPLGDYMADRLIVGDKCKISRADLYGDYQSWAVQVGEKHPLSRAALFDAIRRHPGIAEKNWKEKSIAIRGFVGVGLASRLQVAAVTGENGLNALTRGYTERTGIACNQLQPATDAVLDTENADFGDEYERMEREGLQVKGA
jgi:putative DNA primase/helicase